MTAQEKGEKGEKYFADKLVFPFFYDGGLLENTRTKQRIYLEDITANRIEGDYRIVDGSINPPIAEVKTNTGRYNNIIIETAEGNRPGWYQHCKDNGIDFIIHNRYRSDEDNCPVYSILLFFPKLTEYIDRKMYDAEWAARHIHHKRQVSSWGYEKEYTFYTVDYLNELIYEADCCMKIAYPKAVDDKHCMTLPEIINRTCIPESYFFKVEQILTPWR